MIAKIILLAASLHGCPDKKNVSRDSFPPLHTIRGEDINAVTSPGINDTLFVQLKNDSTYRYTFQEWDYEDVHFILDQQIRDEINHIKRTFTRAEHAPQFPGGEEALEKYLREFCVRHKEVFEGEGSAKFFIQFVVHLQGEVTDVRVASDPGNPKLSALAVQAIQDGPAWIPATQNGHIVLCYKMQAVNLGL